MIIYIPIKNNSQRVPNKNFRIFNGLPLWEHMINKLRRYTVYVDTDSESIIKQCEDKPWVNAYQRDEHLIGDYISVIDLLINFRDSFKINDVIAQIHVTSPFFNIKHLNQAEERMRIHDSVFSVDVVQDRFWRKEAYGYVPINHNPLKLEQTQDLPKFYKENSYLYMFNSSVLDFGNRIGRNPYALEIEYPYNIDIDTENDWEYAVEVNKML